MAVVIAENHLRLDEAHDLGTLRIEMFRVIHDFEIHSSDTGSLGVHLSFSSAKEGCLARFPWWDHVDADLRRMSEDDVLVGTIDEPYSDMEQGWTILIWERDGHVFVMEGSDPGALRYDAWFAVPREVYFSAWSDAIERARSAGGAFKTLFEARQRPDAVRSLLLGNQGLTELPAEIGSFTNLEHLDLHLNHLSTLPAEIGQLKHLRWLDLRFNKIEALPETFAMLESLEAVYLGENLLRSIPPWIAGMPKLKTFFVHGNLVPLDSLAWIRTMRPDLEVDYPERGT